MSDQQNAQLTEEELLVANHLINTIPMRDVINLVRMYSIEKAKNLKNEIGQEQFDAFVAKLAEQEKNNTQQAQQNEDIEEIVEDNKPSIILP